MTSPLHAHTMKSLILSTLILFATSSFAAGSLESNKVYKLNSLSELYQLSFSEVADADVAFCPVTLEEFGEVCRAGGAFTLTGGNPLGGTYSGTGVSNGRFDPAVSGIGVFDITYTYSGSGCQGSITKTLTVSDCVPLNIKETAAQASFTVYPNPTDGPVQIEVPLTEGVELAVSIVNANGQVLQQKTYGHIAGEFSERLDLTGRPKGVYFLHFTTAEGVMTKRIVLK
jgi:hypothetical protein